MTKHDRLRRFAVDVLPAILYVAAIFYGGSIPLSAPRIDLGLPFDKLLHVAAFGGLELLLVRAVRHEFAALGFAQRNLVAAAAASGFGLLLKLYQATLPHRSAELLDWVADTLGVSIAAALVQLPLRRLFEPAEPASPVDSR